jgi:hypothetical protein
MHKTRIVATCLLLGLLATGCGSGPNMIKAKGRVVKGGQPYVPPEDQGLRIFFVPVQTPADHYESYMATFNKQDSTFVVIGRDGAGLPPGNYRVSVELLKQKADQFKKKYTGMRSPFTFEVNKENKELVIDLDTKSIKG